jgi:ubiquinone/menaquinone biosynthesis C-methylase UbiE
LHRGLDLGCGDGGNLGWLAKYVKELYGSDYNLVRLRRAVHSKSARLLFMADITDYPANDNTFDLIFFDHVLEHVPEDLKALTEGERILKPGGLVIIDAPNKGAFFWQLAYKLQPKVRRGTDHVHFYTAKSLIKKCCKAGLKILEISPIGWGIPHWSLDEKIRTYKLVDDLLERMGRALAPSQATSLYLIGTK